MKRDQFTQGPILKPLVRFTIPIMLGMLLQSAYGAVDTLVVSWFANNEALTAVGTASIVMICITNFVMGISTGMTVVIGNRLGGKRNSDASRCVGSSAVLFFIIAGIFTCLIFVFMHPIATALNILPEVMPSFTDYMTICSCGMIFIVAYNYVTAVYNSLGDSKTPLMCVGVACIVNIAADIVFVALLGMGAKGTAIATIASQAISVIAATMIFLKKNTVLIKSDIKLKPNQEDFFEVIKLGLPIGLQASLTTVSMLYITSVINSFGIVFSSAAAIGGKVVVFASIPFKSYSSSLSAFVAHNVGAEKPERAKKALGMGIISSLVVGVVIFCICFFAGKPIYSIFTKDTDVIFEGVKYLKGFALDCIVACFAFCLTGYFNGTRHTYYVMFQSLFCAFAVRIPYAYYLSTLSGIHMSSFGLANPIASSVGTLIYLIYFIYLNKYRKQIAQKEILP